jgi:hypothetical protein
MNLPKFTAECSLDTPNGFIGSSASASSRAVLQACPPLGLCGKACRYCPDGSASNMWCSICERCFDCGAWD